MRTRVSVIQGQLAESEPHRTSAIEAAYQHFQLDKQGSLVSPKTLQHHEWTIRPFLRWLDVEHPEVPRFEQVNVQMIRQYRVRPERMRSRFSRTGHRTTSTVVGILDSMALAAESHGSARGGAVANR